MDNLPDDNVIESTNQRLAQIVKYIKDEYEIRVHLEAINNLRQKVIVLLRKENAKLQEINHNLKCMDGYCLYDPNEIQTIENEIQHIHFQMNDLIAEITANERDLEELREKRNSSS